MKILELGKFYPPVRGGIETLLKAMCEGFARKGAEVECVVANTSRQPFVEHVNGVVVRRIGSRGMIFSTSICPGYSRAARESEADFWHAHFPNPNADLAVCSAPKDVPVIVTYHSDIIRQAFLMRFYAPIVRKMLARADRIVVASPRHLEFSEILRPHEKKCAVIPFGIDLSRFDGPESAQPRGGPILLTVGRLVGYKGHRWLIEAMRSVDATLWVVGSGPLEAQLRRQTADAGLGERVQFMGDVPDEKLPALYQACDVFVLPSVTRNEAFGLVQLEAMACGKPVISCNLDSGVPWVNQDGVTGFVVPPRDSQALANAIQRVCESNALAAKLGASGRARVANEFTEDRMINDYFKLFQTL